MKEAGSFPSGATRDAPLLSAVVLTYFILVFGLITVIAFLQKSPTTDEPIHLFAGYSYLKWGDFRANPEHPPLAKIWATLPLLAFDIKDSRPSTSDWDMIPEDALEGGLHTLVVANDMLFLHNDAEILFFYAKLSMIALGILLGIFVYLWSKELFGVEAAIAALFLYALDPNVLAHSQIVHTDLPFTAFFFISTYFFWRAMGQLTWFNLLLASLFFGLAAITKYSFPVILPIWAVLGLVKVLSSEPQQVRIGTHRVVASRWGKVALSAGILVSAGITTYLFIWAAYGFRFNAIPGEGRYLPLAQVMPQNPLLKASVPFLTEYHLFPEAWIYGQLLVLYGLLRPTYLLGQISDSGFWLYFPVAFAVKTPLPTLLLLLVAVRTLIFKRTGRKPQLFLLIPVVVYFSFAVWSRLNIGLRHILPIYPFLFVLIGGTVAELWSQKTWLKKWGLIFLGVWYLWSSITIYPDYLTFFNELVGGAKNGHKVLLDSNLDWGQDLKGLKRWMDNNNVRSIQLLYFGMADPTYYGIDAVYLPGNWIVRSSRANENPEAAKHLAISANFLYGIRLGKAATEQIKEFYKSLRWKEPVATIGHSIYVYRLD